MTDYQCYIYLFGQSTELRQIEKYHGVFLTFPEIEERIGHRVLKMSNYRYGLDDVRNFCNENDDDDIYYVLCPLYAQGDFQCLVTGKTIPGIDFNDEAAARREVEEETGIYIDQKFDKFRNSYKASVFDASLTSPSRDKRVYGDFINYNLFQFKQHENMNRRYSRKVSTIVYGSLDYFTEIFENQNTSYRLKFAEPDIIGFLLVPTTILLDVININT